MRTSGYIDSGTQRLHYLQWGSGPRLLLAFHGYSNDAWLFSGLAAAAGDRYTTISIDLPHHGRSDWPEAHPWTTEALLSTVRALMDRHRAEQITLAGFSLGGRICLKLAELLPEAIGRLILIAPDGLVPNHIYHFLTRNFAGRRLFHHFLDKPDGYFRLAGWLEQRGWIDAARRDFVVRHAGIPAARAFLKKVWPNLALLVPDQRQVRRHITAHRIDTHLFMGRFDRVIPLQHARTFAAGNPHIHVHVLEKSHRMIDGETIHLIAGLLNAS